MDNFTNIFTTLRFKNILIFVLKMNKDLTGLEQHVCE